ncbi:MAG: hypothetical protein IJK81_12575 [Selenomonadaceae bacterium]|nr:hypothetical protein [Selenomonadaceae bacterium]
MVMKLDALTKEAAELEVKDSVQLDSSNAKTLMDSKDYRPQKFLSNYLLAMKRKMLTAIVEVNKWKLIINEQRFTKRLLVYSKKEKDFKSRDWTVFPRSVLSDETAHFA